MNRVVLAPLPGEIDGIVRRVHRRRRADVAGALALSFTVTLGIASFLNTAGTQSLEPTTPVPATSYLSPTPAPGNVAAVRHDPPQPLAARRNPDPAPASPSTLPSATPSPAAPQGKPALRHGPAARPAGVCDKELVDDPIGNDRFCLDVTADPGPDGTTFRIALCTDPDQGNVPVTFPTEQEVDFVVRRDGADLWTWSADQSFGPDGRRFYLTADACYAWHVVWDGTDDNGRALPAGTYTLHGTSLAQEMAGQPGQDTTFTQE